jgi:hypothetical protein
MNRKITKETHTSPCCGADMTPEMEDVGICPDCGEHI